MLEEKSKHGRAVESAVVTSVVSQTVTVAMKKLMSNRYSKMDQKNLETLKRHYGLALGEKPPQTWALDKEGYPTCTYWHMNWMSYLSNARAQKDGPGCFGYHVRKIAEIASGYLESRQRLPWWERWSNAFFGTSRRAGDLEEHIFSEWIFWVVNHAATYTATERVVVQLQRRIDYLGRIDSLVSAQALPVCVALKKRLQQFKADVALQQAQHDAAAQLKRLGEYLQESHGRFAEFLYHFHTAHVTCALSAEEYIADTCVGKRRSASTAYDDVKKTFSGRLLSLFIQRAGLLALGVGHDHRKQKVTVPVLALVTCQIEEMPVLRNASATLGLPEWLPKQPPTEKKSTGQARLTARDVADCLLRCCQAMLRLVQGYYLVCAAQELANLKGNRWAYDKSLLGIVTLMHCIKEDMHQFLTVFSPLVERLIAQRADHCIVRRQALPKDQRGLMHTKAHAIAQQLIVAMNDSKTGDVPTTIKTICQQARRFKLTDSKEKQQEAHFFVNLTHYVQAHRAQHRTPWQRAWLQSERSKITPLEKKHKTSNTDKSDESKVLSVDRSDQNVACVGKEKASAQMGTHSPLTLHRWTLAARVSAYGVRHRVTSQVSEWSLGQSYAIWLGCFFARRCYRNSIETLNKEAQVLVQLLQSKAEKKDQSAMFAALRKHQSQWRAVQQSFMRLLAQEAPRWRFKKGMWPIATAGWPFNRKAARFAKALQHKLLLLGVVIHRQVEAALKYAGTKKPIPKKVESQKVPACLSQPMPYQSQCNTEPQEVKQKIIACSRARQAMKQQDRALEKKWSKVQQAHRVMDERNYLLTIIQRLYTSPIPLPSSALVTPEEMCTLSQFSPSVFVPYRAVFERTMTEEEGNTDVVTRCMIMRTIHALFSGRERSPTLRRYHMWYRQQMHYGTATLLSAATGGTLHHSAV